MGIKWLVCIARWNDHPSQNCKGGEGSPVCTLLTSSLSTRLFICLSVHHSSTGPYQVLQSVFPIDSPAPSLTFFPCSLPLPLSVSLGKGAADLIFAEI